MNTRQLQTTVIKKLEELMGLARRHYNNDDLKFGDVRFDLKSARTMGMAVMNGLVMRFNMPVLEAHPDEYLDTTVPHELAHIITFQLYPRASAHGKEWKSVMRLLGADPSRCSKLDISSIKFPNTKELKCDCMVHQVSTRLYNNIMIRGKRYSCKRCKTPITA